MINKSISNLFTPLYDLLQRYKVDTPQKFNSISVRNRKALSGHIALFFKDNLRSILDLIEISQGIVFNFDDFNPKFWGTDKIARKAIFYSDVSVILLSGRIQFMGADNMRFSKKSKVKKIHKKTNAQNLGGLVSILLSIRTLVEKGIMIPLPGDMNISPEQDYLDPGISSDYNSAIEKLRNCDLDNVIIPISLDKWQTRSQIEEFNFAKPTIRNMKPIHIYLPHLSYIDIDTLINLREDHYDSFFRFQQALRRFLVDSSLTKSEGAFLEMAQKVDYEINVLENEVKLMEKQRKQKGYEVAFGISASALTLLVDPQIAKYVAAIIGSKTALDGMNFFSNKKINKFKIENNQYYLAYLVKKLSYL